MEYIARHLEDVILKVNDFFPVVMVCGQRQIGKSTLLRHLQEDARSYVNLDDVRYRRLALEDPVTFLDSLGTPLFIDEFQRAPNLLLEIKRRVDARILDKVPTTGIYWLSGSQKFTMLKDVSESLAGRVGLFDLLGLSAAELEARDSSPFDADVNALKARLAQSKKKSLAQIYERIFVGGMPALHASQVDREWYFSSFINTYLERDIYMLSDVGKLEQFYDFLLFLAARTGQILNYNDIAKSIGISLPTAKAWVGILVRSGVLYLLRPFASNLSKRLTKSPKLYFLDTGLCAYLTRWPNAETLQAGMMDGAFLETYVVSEIVKSYYHAGRIPNIFYYRDSEGREIDLVLERERKLCPIEIKKNADPSHASRHFALLKKYGECGTGLVICSADDLYPLKQNVWLCPLSAL